MAMAIDEMAVLDNPSGASTGLTSQIGVHVFSDALCSLRARLPLLQGHLYLRRTNAHHSKFSYDKESVHRKEERNEQKANAYVHMRQCSLVDQFLAN